MQRRAAQVLFSVFLAISAGSGCLRSSSDQYPSLSSSCAIADDQRESFHAPMPRQVIFVAVDPAFDSQQLASISRAIAEWNALGQSSLGHPFFRATITRLASGDPRSGGDCDFQAPDPTMFEIRRIDDPTRWAALGLSDRNPGVTLRCQRGAELTKQVVMLNTRNIAPMQLASVAVHELGHAVGLDHSCQDGNGTDRFVGCSRVTSADHPYAQAVMYPRLRVSMSLNPAPGTYDVKEELRKNDMERANCLYK